MSRLGFVSLLLIGLAAPSASVYAAFDKIIVFGDSLSDLGASPSGVMSAFKLLGNACTSDFPCPPYFEGRISNGPVAAERLADRLGLNHPARLRGYAVAGAMTDERNIVEPAAPGMAQQITRYLTDTAGTADPNALYLVWGGPNNFANALAKGTLGSSTITGAVDDLSGYMSALARAGARQFLVPNAPDFSLTPDARAAANRYDDVIPGSGQLLLNVVKELSHAFNDQLHEAMNDIESDASVRITLFELDTLLDRVTENPAMFGLVNTTDSCYAGGIVCADPSRYLFWDGLHPTTRAHSIIGGEFLAAVIPEPKTYVLMLMGLGLIGFMMRIRPAFPKVRMVVA